MGIVIQGDALDELRKLATHSVDSIVRLQSLYHATQQTCGMYDRGTQRYLTYSRHFCSQRSLQALYGVHQGRDVEASYSYHNVYMYNHPAFSRLGVRLSNLAHSNQGILRAMMDYFLLYDRHCNSQGSKISFHFYDVFHRRDRQTLYHNLGKLVYAIFFYLLAFLKQQSLLPCFQGYIRKALSPRALLRLSRTLRNDTQENKKYCASPFQLAREYAQFLYHMFRNDKEIADLDFSHVVDRNNYDYTSTAVHVLSV